MQYDLKTIENTLEILDMQILACKMKITSKQNEINKIKEEMNKLYIKVNTIENLKQNYNYGTTNKTI